MKGGRKQKGGKDWGPSPKGAQLVSQIVKAKGHVLGFLESQLGKMAILKLLSLKRLREETSGAQREFCHKPDVSALPVILLLLTRAAFLGPPRSHRRKLVSSETGLKSKHNSSST